MAGVGEAESARRYLALSHPIPINEMARRTLAFVRRVPVAAIRHLIPWEARKSNNGWNLDEIIGLLDE